MNTDCCGKLLILLFVLTLAESAHSAEVTYNAEGRPILFTNLDVGGETLHVTVTWNTSYANEYGSPANGNLPYFWGSADATSAADAMRQALLDDGFTPLQSTSYLWVPSARNSNYFSGPGVFLHLETLAVNNVTANYSQVYNTLGVTRFTLFTDGFESLNSGAAQ